ncbi:hypothetical protein RD1_2217 [Roseobacter denitrificans OCh 114]|uniref:Uncharacterized protein n=1 Tax=Roseobacter denitrificans (strain ATCC 33942 / OCh 114) TaxID=375451 RepID=Q167N4_ROSDO|nr:hypothetical protein RD1_2217 [Roseobacter denitrificans OCh 114]
MTEQTGFKDYQGFHAVFRLKRRAKRTLPRPDSINQMPAGKGTAAMDA